MSMERSAKRMNGMFTIICDQCGHSGDDDGAYGSRAALVREYALENGWKRRGSKDICFSCANPEEEEIENNAPIQDVRKADHA